MRTSTPSAPASAARRAAATAARVDWRPVPAISRRPPGTRPRASRISRSASSSSTSGASPVDPSTTSPCSGVAIQRSMLARQASRSTASSSVNGVGMGARTPRMVMTRLSVKREEGLGHATVATGHRGCQTQPPARLHDRFVRCRRPGSSRAGDSGAVLGSVPFLSCTPPVVVHAARVARRSSRNPRLRSRRPQRLRTRQDPAAPIEGPAGSVAGHWRGLAVAPPIDYRPARACGA